MERDRAFLLALVVAVGLVALLVVLPYLQYLLLAGLLGYVLAPVNRRLAPVVGRRAAAGVLVAVTIFAVLLPLSVVLTVVVREALAVVEAVREGRIDVTRIEAALSELLGTDFTGLFRTPNQQEATALLGNLVDVAGGLTDLLVGATVLLFVLYYLLTDGDRLVRWTRAVTPLPPALQDHLFADLDRLLWGVLVGNGLVAVVQGVLTGIGLLVVGFPSAVFWTVATTLLSLLPLIGASVVWIPAAAYLLLTGRTGPGVFLALYGALIVSLSDNYLRPVATGRGTRVSPGLLVVGIFGGVAALGFVGLFYGPVVLGFLKAVVTAFAREYGEESATHPAGAGANRPVDEPAS